MSVGPSAGWRRVYAAMRVACPDDPRRTGRRGEGGPRRNMNEPTHNTNPDGLDRAKEKLERVRGLVAEAESEAVEGHQEEAVDVVLEAGAELAEAREELGCAINTES